MRDVYNPPFRMNPPSDKQSSPPPDPFAEREASNYRNPVASRELILQVLNEIGEPAGLERLCEHLHISSPKQVDGLRQRLTAMQRDGQIIGNRRGVYGLADHMDLVRGRVQGNRDGNGYFVPDGGGDDWFLSAREMACLFDGDRVLARQQGPDSRGREEATVVEVLERRYREIVGRFYREHGVAMVVADNKRVSHELLIPADRTAGARDGQFVVAGIIEYPSRHRKAIGEVLDVLGDVGDPGVELEVVIRSHGIPFAWPEAARREAGSLGKTISKSDLQHRLDLRSLPFVTIDGEDAKDFDDAVFVRRRAAGGWTLYVAIADVSHYVTAASALDDEARERGTSVYFPGHVIPMLPEELSNELCSLKPTVDRLALVCEMEISAHGELRDFRFHEAVIHSHARLTYTEMADMVVPAATGAQDNLRSRTRRRHEALTRHLDDLHTLFGVLNQRRLDSGALEFETMETRILFGADRKVREVIPVERNDAHRLIEECMLCANVAAARLLKESGLPALYRVHQGPNGEKLPNLREFLRGLGLSLKGGDQPGPADYQRLLRQIADRPDRHLLQTLLIRSLTQAVYQPENIGHFGLNFPAYAHFTSPIRRYPDLLVHRAIRFLIRNTNNPHVSRVEGAGKLARARVYPYNRFAMDELGESCSSAERRADAAGYQVVDWLKCEYMRDHVGDEFEGVISSVTSFGLFVELKDVYIEGLVHISALRNDYYHFDPVQHFLEGERRGVIYRLGDIVKVQVVGVSAEERKIDLKVLDDRAAPGKDEPKSRNDRRGKRGAPRGKDRRGKQGRNRK